MISKCDTKVVPEPWTYAYKIVEVVDGNIRTLFHGLNGSRTMPIGEWLQARMELVKDGTSKTTYISGWHVLLTEDAAIAFKEKMFRTRLDILKVVKVKVGGQAWLKVHSRSPDIFLAEWIKFQ